MRARLHGRGLGYGLQQSTFVLHIEGARRRREGYDTETDPGNHDMVYYSFVDRGETYSSSDNSSLPNPSASDLAIGDELYVVYDTMDPSSSCACDPHAAAVSSEWWRMFVAGMLLGSVPAAVVMARFDSRRSPSIDKREEGELGGELPPYQP